jgi:signal transduction histidine kinase
LVTALGSALAALVLGVFLARSLTNPLEELTGAIRAMSRGQLGQQIPVRSKDEIGELALTFNQMSADLERLNEQRVQMTADIAHDLRTPLTVLGGYLEAMQEKVLDPTPERLETMHTEVQGLIRLVEDLRTLSLADAGALGLARSLTNPEDLLARAAEAFSLQADTAGVDLRIETHPALIQVNVDPERFHQVLSNLVANAIRHTGPGGRVTLAARPEGGSISFEVRDTGEGITPESLPHIFDRFYRVSKAREQDGGESGLGLAIARSLVEAHGGMLTAASEGIGKGSLLTIKLPVSPN